MLSNNRALSNCLFSEVSEIIEKWGTQTIYAYNQTMIDRNKEFWFIRV